MVKNIFGLRVPSLVRVIMGCSHSTNVVGAESTPEVGELADSSVLSASGPICGAGPEW